MLRLHVERNTLGMLTDQSRKQQVQHWPLQANTSANTSAAAASWQGPPLLCVILSLSFSATSRL